MERTKRSLSLVFLEKSLRGEHNITILVSEMTYIMKIAQNNVNVLF